MNTPPVHNPSWYRHSIVAALFAFAVTASCAAMTAGAVGWDAGVLVAAAFVGYAALIAYLCAAEAVSWVLQRREHRNQT